MGAKATVSEAQVALICWLFDGGVKQREIAARLTVSLGLVSYWCCRRASAGGSRSRMSRLTLSEIFWRDVDKTPGHGPRGDCWLWTGARLTGRGYGKLHYRGRTMRANRVALMLAEDRELRANEHACHGCDFPPCVRVGDGHLFIGTERENKADMVAKGRQARGERHPSRLYPGLRQRGEDHRNAKLTVEKVQVVRWLIAGGVRHRDIAKYVGVSGSLIGRIASGVAWRHVAAAAMLLVTLAGVGCGGDRRARVPKPATPVPTASPAPTPATSVRCASYTYDAGAADFAAIEAAGVREIVEYVTYPQARLCERLAGTKLKLWYALYHGDGATAETIKRTTFDQLQALPCPERLAGLYVVDEPLVRGWKTEQILAALAEAKRQRPDLPTFIAYGSARYDKLPVYPNLSAKGIEFYAKADRHPDDIARRLSALAGQPLVLIPRAYRNRDDSWSDADLAEQIRVLGRAAAARGLPLMFYVATVGGDVSKKAQPWLTLPATRAAIAEVCR